MDFLYFIFTLPYQAFKDIFNCSSWIDMIIVTLVTIIISLAYFMILFAIFFGIFYIYALIKDRNIQDKTISTYGTVKFKPNYTTIIYQAGANGQMIPIPYYVPDRWFVCFSIKNKNIEREISKKIYDEYKDQKMKLSVTYRNGVILHIDNWKII